MEATCIALFGVVSIVVAIFGVVTTRRLHIAAQQAQDGLAARDIFVSMAAHDLRNPLNAILLATATLRRKEDTPQPIKERLLIVESAARRAARLIDGLLDISRISADRFTLEPEHADFMAVVHEAVELEHAMSKSPLTVSIEGPEFLYGYFDKLRVEQVVTNLVSNAVKYGNGKPVTVQVMSYNGTMGIAVTDHGLGISKEDQAKVFHRFERASAQAKAGYGLGLWIVSSIVEAMHGSIRLASELGKGTTITVTLPRYQKGTVQARAELAS